MFRKTRERIEDAERHILNEIYRSARELETRHDRQADRLLAAIREASAPTPGVRVFLADAHARPIEYRNAVSWNVAHGHLVIVLGSGDEVATFAPAEWSGVERITPKPAGKESR